MEHAIRCYPSLGNFKPKTQSVNIKIGSNDTLFWLKNDIIYLSKSDQLMYLFLDESGDLSPYTNSARSTRFFVVGMIVVENRQALFSLKAAIKKTRRIKLKHTKYQHNELKGNKASITTKHFFYKELVKQLKKPWKLYFIVLNKAQHHITQEHTTHQLYNAMCNQLLQKVIINRKYKNADLVVDKCKSPKQQKIFNHKLQRTWHQYLQGDLTLFHENSHSNPGLQAIDLFVHGVMRKYAQSDMSWYQVFDRHIETEIFYNFTNPE